MQATTACLSAIVVVQVVNVFLCRSAVRSVFSLRSFENRSIVWGVALEIALLVAANYWLRSPTSSWARNPVPAEVWLLIAPFAVGFWGLEELRKACAQATRPPRRGIHPSATAMGRSSSIVKPKTPGIARTYSTVG